MNRKYFIVAGEPSADNHGAKLMEAMKKIDPKIQFYGIGGTKMEKTGLKSMVSIQKMSVMGFVEVAKHLRFFKKILNQVQDCILHIKPDRVILIDYPGFNLRLASKLKRYNIPITYYICPQVWAWKEKRIKTLKKCVDQLLVIFPFEKNWFLKRGVEVHFVGHPLLDEWKPSKTNGLRIELGLDPKKPLLTLFPGSRKQEIERHLKLFVNAARRVKKRIPDLQIALGLVTGIEKKDLDRSGNMDDIHIIQGMSQKVLESADYAIVASGTSTLEGAVFGTPMVIVYKMSPISWLISRFLVKVQFAGMVNLIAGKKIVCELLQNDATCNNISSHILSVISDNKMIENIKKDLSDVSKKLGGPGASGRAADLIMGR